MNESLIYILVFGLLMACIALVGGLFVLLPERILARWLKPVVALAAGTLFGGALFHMLPHAIQDVGGLENGHVFEWTALGFTAFFALDQLLEWHHCHKLPTEHVRPLGPLLLIADGIHNLLGGLAIGAIFTVDIHAGIAAWVAAAMHEIPQEIGDFGAIVHSGISKKRALVYNFLSALTFPVGALIAWFLGQSINVYFLVALGAGNFIYIASADLVPEIKRAEKLKDTFVRFAAFGVGMVLIWAVRDLHFG